MTSGHGRAVKDRLVERGKYMAYRTPLISRSMAPSYPYKVEPAQLAALVDLLDVTRASGAALAEVGVAKGDTSVFLLQHLRQMADPRTLLLLDTFAGFTDSSVEVEVNVRGKWRGDYDKFRYGSEHRFRRNLERAGYRQFKTVAGDASDFDWESIGPIGMVLLDVDVYEPTIKVLEAVYPHLVRGGGVLVDDCLPGGAWDGSLQAYTEFIEAHGLPYERVGVKGAMVRKA